MTTILLERRIAAPASSTIDRVAEYVDVHHGTLPLNVMLHAFGLPSFLALRHDAHAQIALTCDERCVGRERDAIALTWAPEFGEPFPTFRGTITARPHNDGAIVTLEGGYRPPFGWFGACFDRLFGRRVALACASTLLIDIERFLVNYDLHERDLLAFAAHDANMRAAGSRAGLVPLHGNVAIRHDGTYLAVHVTFDGRWSEPQLERIAAGDYRLDEASSRIVLHVLGNAVTAVKMR